MILEHFGPLSTPEHILIGGIFGVLDWASLVALSDLLVSNIPL